MSFDELNKTDLGYNGFTDFEAGAQSRQYEIDELVVMVKTSADSEMYLFDVLQKVEKERDELQKKVDVALKHVVDHGGYDDLTHVINILKGEKQ